MNRKQRADGPNDFEDIFEDEHGNLMVAKLSSMKKVGDLYCQVEDDGNSR